MVHGVLRSRAGSGTAHDHETVHYGCTAGVFGIDYGEGVVILGRLSDLAAEDRQVAGGVSLLGHSLEAGETANKSYAIRNDERLGAVVEAFDVRPAAKEQVESLGAKFVEVPFNEEEKANAETAGGYATEMSEDYKRRQSELVHERAVAADIVITTALIPGRPAPVLIKEETVKAMKPGSVIVDMAVEAGGNCPLSELDKTIVKHDVHLVGIANIPGLVAADSSTLYARNLMNFLNLIVDAESGKLNIDREDEIVAGTLVCGDGNVVSQA